MQKNCTQCGSIYESKAINQKYCCRSCSDRAYRSSLVHKEPTHKCRHCNTGFKPKRADRIHYCSRECYFKQAAIDKEFKIQQADPPFSRLFLNCCSICSKSWFASKSKGECSKECELVRARQRGKDKYLNAYEVRKFQCKQCLALVTTRYKATRRTFCSEKCSDKYKYTLKSSNNYQRAKKLGNPSERFNELLVLARDGWRCQLCGVSTPSKLRGLNLPRSPEIDHIIPISNGGGHVWSNVQCACRQCNSKKGSKALGQLMLFGEYKIPNRINELGGSSVSPQQSTG